MFKKCTAAARYPPRLTRYSHCDLLKSVFTVANFLPPLHQAALLFSTTHSKNSTLNCVFFFYSTVWMRHKLCSFIFLAKSRRAALLHTHGCSLGGRYVSRYLCFFFCTLSSKGRAILFLCDQKTSLPAMKMLHRPSSGS